MPRYRRLKIEGGAFLFTLALADRGGKRPNYPDASVTPNCEADFVRYQTQ